MDASRWLSIGEFARLGGVSIKALRLYAALDLLPPIAVNPRSRYRLYAHSQLPTLHRILLLKSAGFALREIRRHLSGPDDASLHQVRARLIERAEEIQRQHSWIDAEIRAPAPVVVKRVPRLRVWSRRQTIGSYEEADLLLRDLARRIQSKARLVSGAVWHECGHASGRIDCEVFWLAPRGVRGCAPDELAPATVASILHEGPESAIGSSYETAHRWLRDHRRRITGPNRELYLDAAMTEIQFPFE